MSTVYGEPEKVRVERDDDGKKIFVVSTRDGPEIIGAEIKMLADHYETGTKITLVEPLNEGSAP